jgi:hypothetical protein
VNETSRRIAVIGTAIPVESDKLIEKSWVVPASTNKSEQLQRAIGFLGGGPSAPQPLVGSLRGPVDMVGCAGQCRLSLAVGLETKQEA